MSSITAPDLEKELGKIVRTEEEILLTILRCMRSEHIVLEEQIDKRYEGYSVVEKYNRVPYEYGSMSIKPVVS